MSFNAGRLSRDAKEFVMPASSTTAQQRASEEERVVGQVVAQVIPSNKPAEVMANPVMRNIFQAEDKGKSLYWVIRAQGQHFASRCVKEHNLNEIQIYDRINHIAIKRLKNDLKQPSYLFMKKISFEEGCEAPFAEIIATNPYIEILTMWECNFQGPVKISPYTKELSVDIRDGLMDVFPDISQAKSLVEYEVFGKQRPWWINDHENPFIPPVLDIPPGLSLQKLHMYYIHTTSRLQNAIHLKRLDVWDSNLPSLSLEANTSLQEIQFVNCSSMELPDFSHLTQLKALGLFKLENLVEPPKVPAQITTLVIQDCPRLNTPPKLSHVLQFERLIQDRVPYYTDLNLEQLEKLSHQTPTTTADFIPATHLTYSTNNEINTADSSSDEQLCGDGGGVIFSRNPIVIEGNSSSSSSSTSATSATTSFKSTWDEEDSEENMPSRITYFQGEILSSSSVGSAVSQPSQSTSSSSSSFMTSWNEEDSEEDKPTVTSYSQIASNGKASTISTSNIPPSSSMGSTRGGRGAASNAASRGRGGQNQGGRGAASNAASRGRGGQNQGGRGVASNAASRGRGVQNQGGRGAGRGHSSSSSSNQSGQRVQNANSSNRGSSSQGKPSSSSNARAGRKY